MISAFGAFTVNPQLPEKIKIYFALAPVVKYITVWRLHQANAIYGLWFIIAYAYSFQNEEMWMILKKRDADIASC